MTQTAKSPAARAGADRAANAFLAANTWDNNAKTSAVQPARGGMKLSTVLAKIATCIEGLSSESDMQVVGCAREIGRLLCAAKLTWTDLAAAAEFGGIGLPCHCRRRAVSAALRWSDIEPGDRLEWVESMRSTLDVGDWDFDFLTSTAGRLRENPRLVLSEKQEPIINRLLRRAAIIGVRP